MHHEKGSCYASFGNNWVFRKKLVVMVTSSSFDGDVSLKVFD